MTTLLRKSQSFCSSSVLSEKCFVVFYVFSFPAGVYVGTLKIASIPDPSILTFLTLQAALVMILTYFRNMISKI